MHTVSLEMEKSTHTWISIGTNEGITSPGQSTRRTSEVQKRVWKCFVYRWFDQELNDEQCDPIPFQEFAMHVLESFQISHSREMISLRWADLREG